MSDWHEGGAFAAFRQGAFEDNAVDVGGVDGGSDGNLADVTEGGAVGVDYG